MVTIGVDKEFQCKKLLRELEHIWEDVGETEDEKDQILFEIDRECSEIYRRKVDEATKTRRELHQSVAAKEAEVAALVASLGENSPNPMDKKPASLREKHTFITPKLELLKRKKEERIEQFTDIRLQIENIANEIAENEDDKDAIVGSVVIDEHDLSERKINEYNSLLRALQKEKSNRLQEILEYIHEVQSLCGFLGVDYRKTVDEIHPSLLIIDPGQSTNISKNTLESLAQTVQQLVEEKKFRTLKLRESAHSLFKLWHIMGSSEEDRNKFTGLECILESSDEYIAQNGFLSKETLQQAEAEVERLTKVRNQRIKGLFSSRIYELQEECKKAHIEPEMSTEETMQLIESGKIDPSELLSSIDTQILKVKEESASRKEIMDRISKWLMACDEENWLEAYNQDNNRYNAGRGAHLNLKRAEKARIVVSKIAAMVDNLMTRTYAWEKERNKPFLYDGARLITMLEEYKVNKQRKEDEKKRLREQKKLQSLLVKEKEKQSTFGTKPSPKRSNSFDRTPTKYNANGKNNGSMTPNPRRSSFGGASANPDLLTPRSYSGHHTGYFKDAKRLSTKPLKLFDVPKEDSVSTFTSISGSEHESVLLN